MCAPVDVLDADNVGGTGCCWCGRSFYFMLLLLLIMMMNADGDNSVIMNED